MDRLLWREEAKHDRRRAAMSGQAWTVVLSTGVCRRKTTMEGRRISRKVVRRIYRQLSMAKRIKYLSEKTLSGNLLKT
jgi:hypothetical protein